MGYIGMQFDLLDQNRRNVVGLMEQYSSEQWEVIPPGFANHLLWNAGHLLVTQQLLTYGLSGQKMLVPGDWIEKYRKGSRPQGETDLAEAEAIMDALQDVPRQSRRDYEDGLFTSYKTYETSFGITLHSLEEAIAFNNLHEGLHLGTMMAIRKFL